TPVINAVLDTNSPVRTIPEHAYAVSLGAPVLPEPLDELAHRFVDRCLRNVTRQRLKQRRVSIGLDHVTLLHRQHDLLCIFAEVALDGLDEFEQRYRLASTDVHRAPGRNRREGIAAIR